MLFFITLIIIFSRHTYSSKHPVFLNSINLWLPACAFESLNKDLASYRVRTGVSLIGGNDRETRYTSNRVANESFHGKSKFNYGGSLYKKNAVSNSG